LVSEARSSEGSGGFQAEFGKLVGQSGPSVFLDARVSKVAESFAAYHAASCTGVWGLAKLGKLAKFCKFLAGSFSAVSKRNFARKYAFDSIFQALQDLHPFAPLQSQNFRKKSV
jgi:hypothetical protein